MNDFNAPTLNDVAKAAGVSTATVSRVLNAPDNVKENTKLRVQEAILELGYAPNFGARALAAKRTFIIGAVIPTMENSIFATGIQAFQTELTQEGYTLLVASSSYKRKMEEEQIKNLISRSVDGLLLIGLERDPAIYEFLHKRQIPYILAWNYKKSKDHVFVGFDNYHAAKLMAQKVIDYGHKNIGILAGVTKDNDRALDRLRGFTSALNNSNITINEKAIIEVSYNIDHAAEAFSKLYQENPQLSAVLCGNDVIAVGAMRQAQIQGVNLPKDMSFVGFDDIQISEIISPALTTMHVPHRQMGRHAARLLIKMIKTECDVASIQLDPYIVERKSLIQISSNRK